ncbi:MAG: transcriptional regulator, partial [Proteobacteria bacterium]
MALTPETLINLTADIASAHLGNNTVPLSDVAPMIEGIYSALQALGAPAADPIAEKPKGAV